MITYDCEAVSEEILEELQKELTMEEVEEVDPLLDPETIYNIYMKLLPTLIAIGLAGNLLNVIVFSHRRLRMPSGFHLTLLAVALMDSGVLILSILDVVVHETFYDLDLRNEYKYKLCDFIKYPLQNFFKLSSIWLLVLSAFMRFIGVCYPFKAACWFSKKRTSIEICVIVLFCALCNIPRVFESELLVCQKEDTLFTIKADTEMSKSYLYKSLFPWFSSTIFFLAPFILLSFFNVVLMKNIWKQKSVRYRLSNRKSLATSVSTNTKIQVNEKQITVMMIVIITLFLLLESPVAVLDILHESSVKISAANVRRNILDIVNMISISNCTVNFFIYLIFSKQFRQVLALIFTCNFKDDRRSSTLTNPSRSSCLPPDDSSKSRPKLSSEYEKLNPKFEDEELKVESPV